MAKVTFDGDNKLIIVNNGITTIDIKTDVYSDWKEWIVLSDNSKYPQVISVIGGDEISPSIFLGATFFLENGWKIRPYEGNHTLTVSGNLYTRDGSSPFVSTVGSYNVLIKLTTSNLINTVATDGSGGSSYTPAEIADAVWAKPKSELTASNTAGNVLVNTESNTEDIQALIFAA